MRRFLASFGFWRGDSLQIASHDADVNAPKDGYSSPGVMSSFHGGSISTSESRSSGDFWRLQLEAIYRKRNPYKLRRVPEMLENWTGEEAVLYRRVCLAYDLEVQFYACQSKWPEDTNHAATSNPRIGYSRDDAGDAEFEIDADTPDMVEEAEFRSCNSNSSCQSSEAEAVEGNRFECNKSDRSGGNERHPFAFSYCDIVLPLCRAMWQEANNQYGQPSMPGAGISPFAALQQHSSEKWHPVEDGEDVQHIEDMASVPSVFQPPKKRSRATIEAGTSRNVLSELPIASEQQQTGGYLHGAKRILPPEDLMAMTKRRKALSPVNFTLD